MVTFMFAVVLSVHILVCVFLVVFVLFKSPEGGGLGIGQSNSGGLGDFYLHVVLQIFLLKQLHFLLFAFLTSISLVIIANKNYKKESIIDSGEDSIIDRLDLIPEEFDVENINENDEDVSVPVD